MKISVALCTYNGEKYIEEQLRSILKQTVSVDEIVICDDGSTDNTVAVASSVLGKGNIPYRIEVNETSLGVAKNFLKALRLTSGDYVFTCDQDDIWHKGKVEAFINEARESKKELYFSDGELVFSDGAPMGSTIWQALCVQDELHNNPNMTDCLLKHPVVTGAAMMVSRGLIDRVDAIPDGWIHDEWLSVLAALEDGAQPICVPTFDYRQHGNNVIGVKKRGFFGRLGFWLSMLKKLKQYRKEQSVKKKDVLKVAKEGKYSEAVSASAEFWATLDGLADKGFLSRVKTVINLYKKGWYNEFYTGKRGFLRDLISCFL